MNKVKFMGAQPPKCEKLPNGGTRFYYNVTEGEPFVNPTQNEDGSEGEPEILPTWDANYTDMEGDVTRDNLINALIRERFSLSNELAILRQRDAKPEDFAAYNEVAEACKRIADELLAEEV
ncbi:MAG: hypothetical protein J5953_05745 [Prevotella sp.]|nr:hypothetical protein [Prevotella sp.]